MTDKRASSDRRSDERRSDERRLNSESVSSDIKTLTRAVDPHRSIAPRVAARRIAAIITFYKLQRLIVQ